jgi:hypothetical protein
VAGFTLRWVVGHILWNSETCNWYMVVTKVWSLTAGKKCCCYAGQVVDGEHTIYQGIQLTYGILFLVLHFQFSWLFDSVLSLLVTLFSLQSLIEIHGQMRLFLRPSKQTSYSGRSVCCYAHLTIGGQFFIFLFL